MFKTTRKAKYKTLNLIEVSKNALLHNYAYFQKLHPEAKICPVLKSNAYGHGLESIAQFIDQSINPSFICVDSLYEAYKLQKVRIKTPILIMGYTFPQNFRVFKKLKFSFPVYDQETLKVLNYYQPGVKVHLKIDTGMNRLGIKINETRKFAKLLKKYPRLNIEGIYSHLAQTDNPRSNFTQKQISTFKEVIAIFKKEGFSFKWKHICATAGATQIFDPEFNLIRLGLGFYGISPFRQNSKADKTLIKSIKPALKLTSHIVQTKNITKGEQVSYGGSFIAKKPTKIAILPLGFYDGIDRELSNKGYVRIGNKFCPIIGKVCMNLTVIDISEIPKTKVGRKVIIFDNKDVKNSFKKSAAIAQTTPYALLVNLSETTKRILV